MLLLGRHYQEKKLIARQIHEASARRAGPFVFLDARWFPTLDAGLFGEESNPWDAGPMVLRGRIEEAQGGTLLLDGLSAIPPTVEQGLVRLIDTKRICRVGTNRDIVVDVRLILGATAAAHRKNRIFFHRIRAEVVEIPRLSEHPADAALLARFVGRELDS